jgi:hypothetical protein
MNCYAGLAWMNNATSYLPKQEKMKIFKYQPEEVTKRLFRQLFDLQIRLEKAYELNADPEIKVIIEKIDHLLQTILDNTLD